MVLPVEKVVRPEREVWVINDCPTRDKSTKKLKRCLRNAYGAELSKILKGLGIKEGIKEFGVGDVVNRIPPMGDVSKLYGLKRDLKNGYEERHGEIISPGDWEEIKKIRTELSYYKPKLVICTGDFALFAVTGKRGIDSYRGSMLCGVDSLSYIRVLPTYSLARVFKQWPIRRIVSHDIRRGLGYRDRDWPTPEYKFITGIDFKKICEVLDELAQRAEQGHHISVDIETRFNKHISCIGFAWSRLDAICVPIIRGGFNGLHWTTDELLVIVDKIREILECESVFISGQNFCYDAQYLARDWGIKCKVDFDTMISQHVFLAADIKKDLNTLSSLYCEYHMYWKDEGKGHDVKEEEEEGYWIYNCKDACCTWEIAEVMKEGVIKGDLEKPFEFQHKHWFNVLKCNLRGIRKDVGLASEMWTETNNKMIKLQNFCRDMVAPSIRPLKGPTAKAEFFSSDKQLMDLFYNVLGLTPVTKREGREWKKTVNDNALKVLSKREPLVKPLCEAIGAMRSLKKSLEVIECPLDWDNRWRCTYQLAGTETYRFASKPDAFSLGRNLQNISKGDR